MTVRTSRGPVQLARCRLILDTEKCKIKFKSAALALVIPGAVTTQDDVSNDEMFEDDVIDPEKALSEAAFTVFYDLKRGC